MANKYGENDARAILLNNGSQQLLPVSKAQLIELAYNQTQGLFGDAKDVAGALTYLINNDAAVLEAAKTYTGESIGALNATITPESGYVFGSITETAGKLTSYSQVWLDASVVSYNGDSNVKSAIEDLQATLAGLAGDGQGSVQSRIEAAINNLNAEVMSETGKAIVSVSEANGIVTATAGNINAAYVNVDNTTLGWDIDGNNTSDNDVTVQSAIAYLDTQITALETGAARYAIEKRTQNLDANVKEQYVLRQTVNGTTTDVQVPINIYKDSQLLAAKISTADATYSNGEIHDGSGDSALVLVYSVYDQENDAWTEEVVPIPVADFFSDLTAGNGLTQSNGVINVVKGANSENFLTVNSDSIEITGVQTAINTAETAAKTYTGTSIEALDSEIAAKTENGFSYVMTGVTEADGKLTAATYVSLDDSTVKTTPFTGEDLATLLGDNISSVTNVHNALNAIAGKVNNTQAGAVNNIVITDGSYIKATNASKDGNNTYSFTIDDSALGNVAKLQYDELTWNDPETVTILGANPNE